MSGFSTLANWDGSASRNSPTRRVSGITSPSPGVSSRQLADNSPPSLSLPPNTPLLPHTPSQNNPHNTLGPEDRPEIRLGKHSPLPTSPYQTTAHDPTLQFQPNGLLKNGPTRTSAEAASTGNSRNPANSHAPRLKPRKEGYGRPERLAGEREAPTVETQPTAITHEVFGSSAVETPTHRGVLYSSLLRNNQASERVSPIGSESSEKETRRKREAPQQNNVPDGIVGAINSAVRPGSPVEPSFSKKKRKLEPSIGNNNRGPSEHPPSLDAPAERASHPVASGSRPCPPSDLPTSASGSSHTHTSLAAGLSPSAGSVSGPPTIPLALCSAESGGDPSLTGPGSGEPSHVLINSHMAIRATLRPAAWKEEHTKAPSALSKEPRASLSPEPSVKSASDEIIFIGENNVEDYGNRPEAKPSVRPRDPHPMSPSPYSPDSLFTPPDTTQDDSLPPTPRLGPPRQVRPNHWVKPFVEIPPLPPGVKKEHYKRVPWRSKKPSKPKPKYVPVAGVGNLADALNAQIQHNAATGPPLPSKSSRGPNLTNARATQRVRKEQIHARKVRRRNVIPESCDSELTSLEDDEPSQRDCQEGSAILNLLSNTTPGAVPDPIFCCLQAVQTSFPNVQKDLPAVPVLAQHLQADWVSDGWYRGPFFPDYVPEEEGDISIYPFEDSDGDIETFDTPTFPPSLHSSPGKTSQSQANSPLRARKPSAISSAQLLASASSRTPVVVSPTKLGSQGYHVVRKQASYRKPRKRRPSIEVVSESDYEPPTNEPGRMSAKARGKQKTVEPVQDPPARAADPTTVGTSGVSEHRGAPKQGPVDMGQAATVIEKFARYRELQMRGLLPPHYPTIDELIANEDASAVIATLFQAVDAADLGSAFSDASAPFALSSASKASLSGPSLESSAPTFENETETAAHQIPATVDPSLLHNGGDPAALLSRPSKGKQEKARFWSREDRASARRTSDRQSLSGAEDLPLQPKKGRKRKEPTKAAQDTDGQPKATKAPKGSTGQRRDWPVDEQGRAEFCHHCRTKSTKQKMACTICTKAFCVRCIMTKYTGLEFKHDDDNWTCLVCSNQCGCDQCTRKRGEVYVAGQIVNLDSEVVEEIPPFAPVPAPTTRPLPKVEYFGAIYGSQGEVLAMGFAETNGESVYANLDGASATLVVAPQRPQLQYSRSNSPVVPGRAYIGSRPFSEEPPKTDLLALTGYRAYAGSKHPLTWEDAHPPPPSNTEDSPPTPALSLTPLPDSIEMQDIRTLFADDDVPTSTRDTGQPELEFEVVRKLITMPSGGGSEDVT